MFHGKYKRWVRPNLSIVKYAILFLSFLLQKCHKIFLYFKKYVVNVATNSSQRQLLY